IFMRWEKNTIPSNLMNKRNKYCRKNEAIQNFANEATSLVDEGVHLLNKDVEKVTAFAEKLKSQQEDLHQ
ncbi:hypothetical protein Tco_1066813, partial [Tanacetum coccineum]